MSDTNNRPNMDGSLRGDDRPMPKRGTGTGFSGKNPMLDGRSTGPDDTNSLGSCGGCGSDPVDATMNRKSTKS